MSKLPFPRHLVPPARHFSSNLRSEMLGERILSWDENSVVGQSSDALLNRFVLVGIPDDRGVEHNHGFTGASGGPDAFRQAFYRLYDSRLPDGEFFGGRWFDVGNVALHEDIAETHARLAEIVHWALNSGACRVHVIGGGHDFSYGSYAGHARTCAGLLPIINFDAHFDLRLSEGGRINSGTPFRRVIDNLGTRVSQGRALFEIGIQRERNPQSLWDYAAAQGIAVAEYCAGGETWRYWNVPDVSNRTLKEQLDAWIAQWQRHSEFSGHLHASVDLDVFHVAAAMGTSASTSFGVPVETLWPCVEDVMSRRICRVVDVAELCPARDSQMQTARLAAALVFRGALSLEMTGR